MTSSNAVDAGAFHDFEQSGWEISVPAYDMFLGPLTRSVIPPLLDRVKVQRGMRVLDVATGPGYAAAAVAERGASVVAMDFAKNMVRHASEIQAGKNIHFEVGDAEDLSAYTDFDAIVMNFGILHLARPDQAIREAHRALKSGGTYGFTVWAKPEKAQGFTIIMRAVEQFGDPDISLPVGPPFFRFSDPNECERVLEQSGFAQPEVLEVPLVWRLASSDDLFKAFYEGTARTGGLLRAQAPDRLDAIKKAVRENCAPYHDGTALSIPMPALVVTARKQS